jgi:hypothetical protein
MVRLLPLVLMVLHELHTPLTFVLAYWVQSVPGQGSTFGFSLPRGPTDLNGRSRVEVQSAAGR